MTKGNKLYYSAIITAVIIFAAGIYWYSRMAIPSYESDLRNKITGARLQKDGISPYFYHWKPGDNMKYYDYNAFQFIPSKSTSTPFQHRLFYSIADFSQSTINKICFWSLNAIFAACVLLVFLMAKTQKQKILILTTGLLLFFSHSWRANLAEGQTYIIIVFLSLLLFYFLQKPFTISYSLISGLITAVLFLFKPTTILLILPVLIFANRQPKAFIKIYITSFLAIVSFNFALPGEINYWKDYFHAIKEHQKIWQNEGIISYPTIPKINEWEGINITEQKDQMHKHPLYLDNEYSNFFVFSNNLTGKHISVWALYFLFTICFSVLLYLLAKQKPYPASALLNAALLYGALLYFLSDIFSPIIRSQYYAIQWLYPLLLLMVFPGKISTNVYFIIFSGLILNIISLPDIKWEHTLGEVLFFIGIVYMLLIPNKTADT